MGNASTNIASIQQTVTNQVLQANQQACTVNNQVNASGNVVILNGIIAKGNVTAINATSQGTDASCLLSSNMSSSVSTILSASLQQSNETESDWFGGFSFSADTNTFNIAQTTNNQINQINQSICSSNNMNSTNNNYVYASGKVGRNFVGVNNANGQATASCSMQNTMKNISNNKNQASTGQGNVEKGMFVAMVGSFASMIAMIVVLVIIMFAVGAVAYVGYSATSGPKTPAAGTPGATTPQSVEAQEEAELALYDQYGGTSFITGTPTTTPTPTTTAV